MVSNISSDPDILGGTPVFAGTRVPLQNLIDYLSAGDTLDDFLRSFPTVTREQAVEALQHGADLLVFQRTHAPRIEPRVPGIERGLIQHMAADFDATPEDFDD
jgi:uncharacterized protein (DUF433 family)